MCVFVTYLTKTIWVKPIIRPITPLWTIRHCSNSTVIWSKCVKRWQLNNDDSDNRQNQITSVRLRFGHEKKFYDHSQPFHWFKKGGCQLLAKDWALNIGELPRRLAQEQCLKVNWPSPKWPKMCRIAIKHQHSQPARWGEICKEKGIVTILWDQLHQASSATPGKKSRWVLKCLRECRETIYTECLDLLATKMLLNVH